MAQIKFIRGTREQYNNLLKGSKATEVKNSVYFVTDDQVIMMNEQQYGGATGTLFDGFVKNLDVEGQTLTFHKDVKGVDTKISIELIKAADSSIVIGDITKGDGVKDGSTIKVNVKAVGDVDGLKLGDDGLYVDLTKTTDSITTNTTNIANEVTRAKEAEGANATAINQEVTNRKAAINGLNAEIKGGAGKFIQSVKEEKGVITAVEADLTAAAVAYDKTSDKVIAKATDVSAAIKELDAKVAENKAAELTYKTVKLTTEEVTALADVNVKEAYKTVSVHGETLTQVGDTIKIYKDSNLVSIDYTEVDDKENKGQFLKYVYTLADGTEKTVYVDMSKLVDQAEVENGIQAIDGKLSIKLADGNEADFLTVDANGLKLSGVQTAINTAKDAVQKNIDAEVTRAKAAEDKIEASVGLGTNGSHVKTTGHYTSGATTVVGEIAALDVQVKANADKIAANANTNLNLTEVGGTGKVITTVSQANGQVSATAIDLVASAVTRTATADVTGKTVEAALSELATAIKDETIARKGADTTISGNVTTNTNAIVTLNGEETVDGSVKHTAKGYADTTLTNAMAYTDTSLTWIDAGTYGTEA